MHWFGAIEHERWLSQQMLAILDHGHKAYVPAGFGYIGTNDVIDPNRPIEMTLTARSTYIYALGTLMGIPGSRRRCDHGVLALRKFFADPVHGGWFTAIEPFDQAQAALGQSGTPAPEGGDRKDSRSMSYLLEAAAAATIANRPGAHELLSEAMDLELKHFWNEEVGMVSDSFNRDFLAPEPYHGMSSNLHATEAFITVADASGDEAWLERAARIVSFVIEQAQANNWRVPEHFNENWKVQKDYNVGTPANPIRPYGINIGHCLGWANAILLVRAALRLRGHKKEDGLLEAAQEIFERARIDAWRRDQKSGFFFTVDYEGKPLMRQRFAWVVTEGIRAAVALRRTLLDEGASTGDVEHYEHCYRSWLDFCEGYLITSPGHWVAELNANNEPDDTVWPGAPDVYHPVQALLAPRVPLAPSASAALAQGLLDKTEVNVLHKSTASGWGPFAR